MMQNLSNAFIITGIGMGLVFIALLLLWLIMALVVKIKDPVEKTKILISEPGTDSRPDDSPVVQNNDRKVRAAAAAVAIALKLRRSIQIDRPTQKPAEMAGGWQTSIRANQLARRSNLFNRKSRG